jgi:DNA-binding MarR family transcriptional regulator
VLSVITRNVAEPGRDVACRDYRNLVLSEIVVTESATPDQSVLLTLQRATHATLHRLSAELADLDLKASELNALANLADGRGRTVSQLAALVGARPTTLTSVLDRLEHRGLVTRGTLAGDRRSVLVELTASGRVTADTVRQALTDLEDRALGELPAAAVAGFHEVLRALVAVAS